MRSRVAAGFHGLRFDLSLKLRMQGLKDFGFAGFWLKMFRLLVVDMLGTCALGSDSGYA